MLYKLKSTSSLNTELAVAYFIALAGDYPYQFLIYNLKIKLTPTPAKRACGQYKIAVYFLTPLFAMGFASASLINFSRVVSSIPGISSNIFSGGCRQIS
jgi:hypothetical protein